MTDDEKIEDISKITGMPGLSDIRRWRDLVDEAQGGSDHELCGLKAGPNGEMQGIFRKKVNPDV